jgi:hypothetical protein
MPTTTKMGIVYPASTDLVKDGATAMGTISTTVDNKTGMVLLSSTSSSGAVSSISVNNVFNTNFQNYKIIITGVASANQDFGFRLRVGGADDSTASSYVYQYIQGSSTTISGIRSTGNIWYVGVIGSSLKNQLEVNLCYPFETQPTNFYCSASSAESSAFVRLSGGTHNQSTSYTGFSLIASTGTITLDNISVYGMNK